ncbi:MFS transporter [Haloplanus pelagicus]|uniref:MFS transporter n=1 Tax=Haloplanus pelagicus TaxID=2949995 RepID=UPI002041CD84|nr:MFS transporter [Haloplanus sp. HW8-1]
MRRWQYSDTVLTLCTLAFFVTMAGRLAISPLVPDIIDTFDVSNTVIGVALTGMWLTYGIAQYPSGILAERYGERLVIVVSIGGTAVVSLAIAFVPAFVVFVLATLLLGGVAGLHFSVAISFLEGTQERVGTAIGIHNAGGTVAGLLTPIVITWIAVRYGWRPALAAVAVVGIPATLLFARLIRPIERSPSTPAIRDRFSPEFVRRLLSSPSIGVTLYVAVLSELAWLGTASFLPTFLVEHRGQSTTTAGALFSAYFVVQGFAQVGVGTVSDRIGHDNAIVGCMLAGAFGFWLIIAAPVFAAVAVGVGLVGVGMSFGPAVMQRILDELPDEEQNAGFGLVRTIYMIVASLGPAMMGLVADAFDLAISFGFLAALLLSVVAVYVFSSSKSQVGVRIC